MTPELALKLKEAGFPQGWGIHMSKEGDTEYIAKPTLLDLVKSLEGRFTVLFAPQNGAKWTAGATIHENTIENHIMTEGETAEEAVANLWFALNKHD